MDTEIMLESFIYLDNTMMIHNFSENYNTVFSRESKIQKTLVLLVHRHVLMLTTKKKKSEREMAGCLISTLEKLKCLCHF